MTVPPNPLLAAYEGRGTLVDRHGTIRKVRYRLRVYRPMGQGVDATVPQLAGDLAFVTNGNGLDRASELTLKTSDGGRVGIQLGHSEDSEGRILFRVSRTGALPKPVRTKRPADRIPKPPQT